MRRAPTTRSTIPIGRSTSGTSRHHHCRRHCRLRQCRRRHRLLRHRHRCHRHLRRPPFGSATATAIYSATPIQRATMPAQPAVGAASRSRRASQRARPHRRAARLPSMRGVEAASRKMHIFIRIRTRRPVVPGPRTTNAQDRPHRHPRYPHPRIPRRPRRPRYPHPRRPRRLRFLQEPLSPSARKTSSKPLGS